MSLTLILSACATSWDNVYQTKEDHRVSSNLMDYLYPNGQIHETTSATSPKTKSATTAYTKPDKDARRFWSNSSSASKIIADPATIQIVKTSPVVSQQPLKRIEPGSLLKKVFISVSLSYPPNRIFPV
jgi:hypothetical protein